LKQAGFNGEIRLYGDATGKSPKTTGPSDHAVIKSVFPNAKWCIPVGQPHVKDRVRSVNARCTTADGQHHLRVDPSCRNLIADLEQVIFLDNGDLDKKDNPMLTHISDALGYGIHREFPVVKNPVTVGTMHSEYWL
jgi:hypothetical protein